MISLAGREYLLLASGFGDDTGGGLFAYDGNDLEQLDTLSTTGLAATQGRLARLVRGPTGGGWCISELLIYDERGVERYVRLDGVSDPHDIAWDGAAYMVVSSGTNSIVWLSPVGDVLSRWTAPGDGDAWHLNGILVEDGKVFVSAFGRYESHRGWKEAGNHGIVFDLASGEDVLTGLANPHHPRLVDGSWLVCNSGTHELAEVDFETRRAVRTIDLGGWTRGLAVADGVAFVGTSALRASVHGGTASICVVDREKFRLLERIEFPCTEVYDLVLVPERLADGVRRGFNTNPLRAEEGDRRQLLDRIGVSSVRLWSGEPLAPEDCRVQIEATVPDVLPARKQRLIECRIENLGAAVLLSTKPNPVHLAYRWRDPDGVVHEGDDRGALGMPLRPAEIQLCRIAVEAPEAPGEYVLELTLIQEFVRWFDEVDEASLLSVKVRVE